MRPEHDVRNVVAMEHFYDDIGPISEDCAMHGVEENFKKDDLRRARAVSQHMLRR
ncbi:hypothetical protein GVX82_01315 [Patescibacteria group bacterium]|jgi:acetylornithine deacetylase/succinyl-diaminopimelate desuccinylase-like protein|nr:hypothetical protein [Patescibacteria group bacterium]